MALFDQLVGGGIQALSSGATGAASGAASGAATMEQLDSQIAELEGQIASAMQAGGGSPDYSAFYKSPGYDFRLQEGINAIDKSAAARGSLMSGGITRELTRYGQGVASNEFNSYANRLASMAGIGQSATNATGQIGSAAAGQFGQTSSALGQTIMAGGQAQASGIVDSSNAMLQGYQGAAEGFANWKPPENFSTKSLFNW